MYADWMKEIKLEATEEDIIKYKENKKRRKRLGSKKQRR